MAAIDDLVSRVADESLRKSLEAEVEKLKAQKKFGLVWEEHLKERAELWGVAPRAGMKVARKGGSATYLVQEADGEELLCCDEGGQQVNLRTGDVVALADFGEAVYPCLEPLDTLVNSSEGEAGLWHILIEAENFHALELLRYLYRGKVDAIYIDPPYNTGARDWKYNNDYVDAVDSFRHSKWLSMMKARLEVAHELLNPTDSVLIVTIDEKEYAHLACLLEEMFPDARVQMVSSCINPGGVSRDRAFYRTDEYLFFVQFGSSAPQPQKLGAEWLGSIKNTSRNSVHWEGLLRTGPGNMRSDSPNLFYPIYVSEDGKHFEGAGDPLPLGVDRNSVPIPPNVKAIWPLHKDGGEGRWRVGRDTLLELQKEHFVRLGGFTERGMAINYLKRGERAKVLDGTYKITGVATDGSYILDDSDYSPSFVPSTQWAIPLHDASRHGSGLLLKLFCGKRFAFPKSVYAVHDALRFFVADKPTALIVDFFAGSGTTAHAVNLLNAADGGHRRCVMVTNNEVSADEARTLVKRGIKRGDAEWEKVGIAHYVTWPRTVCAITGRDVEGKPLSGTYAGEYPFAAHAGGTSAEGAGSGAGEMEGYAGEGASAGAGASGTGGKEGDTDAEGFTLEAGGAKGGKGSAGLAMSQGFSANAAFFTLRFLDKEAVALGKQFRSLLPLLWLKAGSNGSCPVIADTEELSPWYVFAANRFAVLLEEAHFGGFEAALAKEGESCRMVYLVTDSGSGFREMSEALEGRQCVQLYKDYLENFKINTVQ